MGIRIGRVTNVYPDTGKVKVMYEDEGNASLPLPMLTMNGEYSMPKVGDRVATVHMENGSSKGFVLGTFYGGGLLPKAGAGYRKDFEGGAYAACLDGAYRLLAKGVSVRAKKDLPTDENGAADEDVAVPKEGEVLFLAERIAFECPYGEITVEELLRRMERIEDRLQLPHSV